MCYASSMTTQRLRTIPTGFLATLADQSMDRIAIAYGICRERAYKATTDRARAAWVRKAELVSNHAASRGWIVSIQPGGGAIDEWAGICNRISG